MHLHLYIIAQYFSYSKGYVYVCTSKKFTLHVMLCFLSPVQDSPRFIVPEWHELRSNANRSQPPLHSIRINPNQGATSAWNQTSPAHQLTIPPSIHKWLTPQHWSCTPRQSLKSRQQQRGMLALSRSVGSSFLLCSVG